MANQENVERNIISRLHRLEGQVRSLERVLGQDQPEQAVTQFEAIIAAAKSALVLYLASLAETDISPALHQKLISRVIKKLG